MCVVVYEDIADGAGIFCRDLRSKRTKRGESCGSAGDFLADSPRHARNHPSCAARAGCFSVINIHTSHTSSRTRPFTLPPTSLSLPPLEP